MPSFSFFSLVCLFVLGHTVGPATGKPVCYPYNREIWDEKKKKNYGKQRRYFMGLVRVAKEVRNHYKP